MRNLQKGTDLTMKVVDLTMQGLNQATEMADLTREDEFNSLVRLAFVNGCSDLSKSTRVSKSSDFRIFTRETKYKGNPLETAEKRIRCWL